MKRTLQFKDEKSDKFWNIETLGCELVTNWGKTEPPYGISVMRRDLEHFSTIA